MDIDEGWEERIGRSSQWITRNSRGTRLNSRTRPRNLFGIRQEIILYEWGGLWECVACGSQKGASSKGHTVHIVHSPPRPAQISLDGESKHVQIYERGDGRGRQSA